VTEGNYLLADGPFAPVRGLLDACWFLDVDPALAGSASSPGTCCTAARPERPSRWVAASDDPNARLVDATRERADLVVRLGP
jgi:hypothetical protein